LNALAGKDDAIYAVSIFLATIQTAVTVHAVSKGLGRTESELNGMQVINTAKVSRIQRPLQNDLIVATLLPSCKHRVARRIAAAVSNAQTAY